MGVVPQMKGSTHITQVVTRLSHCCDNLITRLAQPCNNLRDALYMHCSRHLIVCTLIHVVYRIAGNFRGV